MRFKNQLGCTLIIGGTVIRPQEEFESDDEKYLHMLGIKPIKSTDKIEEPIKKEDTVVIIKKKHKKRK